MRIEKISVKNYKTLENFSIELGGNYSTLSGHNNAGKSCILQLIVGLFEKFDNTRFSLLGGFSLNHSEDFTQWVGNREDDIEVDYVIALTRNDDPMMIEFISKMAVKNLSDLELVTLTVGLKVGTNNKRVVAMSVNDTPLTDTVCDDVLDKISNSRGCILHNSTPSQHDLYYSRYGDFYEVDFSVEEQNQISNAEEKLQKKIQKFAKSHKDELNEVLGKLTQKYDVEFTTLNSSNNRHARPIAINLKDKQVKVPLSGWGSGTQNRTRILMSILKAKKHASEDSNQKVTPIIIIEEPESFLHPTAQAEFGRVLEDLSLDLGIQIIAATHSPYMLNQSEPGSNFLLKRKVIRKQVKETELVPASSDKWMAPFAEHLGIIPPEFDNWKDLFGLKGQKVVLVEGELDVKYFMHLYDNFPNRCGLPDGIEFKSYGGKDSLKNTTLLKFVLLSLGDTYVTFDLDAVKECSNALEKLGLKADSDFCSIGLKKAGYESIEGLLPERVRQKVYSNNVDLMQALQSGNAQDRHAAKRDLKGKLLLEFQANKDYSKNELKDFTAIIKKISKRLSA